MPLLTFESMGVLLIRRAAFAAATLILLTSVLLAQDAKPAPGKSLSPTARLTAARTVYLKNAGGSDIPFNVISDGVQGWGRYQVVQDPAKADIIIEVTSPSGDTGVSVGSTTGPDPRTGIPSQSVTSTHELKVARITVIVYDAKSKMALWSASEQPKAALREKTRKDNIVEAAEHLVTKFHQRVEPDAR